MDRYMTDEEFRKKAEAATAALDGGYTSFAGDDSCEDCYGWDGKERRCACGNRRVSWADDGMGGVYAEAW